MCKIYVVGYPKTGTTWLCRLLGDVLDSPVGAVDVKSTSHAVATEGQDRKGKYYIIQNHGIPAHKNEQLGPKVHRLDIDEMATEKIVVIMRDPRDVAVSGSYHWKMPVRRFIGMMAHGKWPMSHGGGFVNFYKRWEESGLEYCLTKYEWLYEYGADEFEIVLSELDVEIVNPIHEVWARQSFEQRRKWTEEHGDTLNYGRDWQLAFLRKGVVGDWKNHCGEKEEILFERFFGEFMREAGYQ